MYVGLRNLPAHLSFSSPHGECVSAIHLDPKRKVFWKFLLLMWIFIFKTMCLVLRANSLEITKAGHLQYLAEAHGRHLNLPKIEVKDAEVERGNFWMVSDVCLFWSHIRWILRLSYREENSHAMLTGQRKSQSFWVLGQLDRTSKLEKVTSVYFCV